MGLDVLTETHAGHIHRTDSVYSTKESATTHLELHSYVDGFVESKTGIRLMLMLASNQLEHWLRFKEAWSLSSKWLKFKKEKSNNKWS